MSILNMLNILNTLNTLNTLLSKILKILKQDIHAGYLKTLFNEQDTQDTQDTQDIRYSSIFSLNILDTSIDPPSLRVLDAFHPWKSARFSPVFGVEISPRAACKVDNNKVQDCDKNTYHNHRRTAVRNLHKLGLDQGINDLKTGLVQHDNFSLVQCLSPIMPKVALFEGQEINTINLTATILRGRMEGITA